MGDMADYDLQHMLDNCFWWPPRYRKPRQPWPPPRRASEELIDLGPLPESEDERTK